MRSKPRLLAWPAIAAVAITAAGPASAESKELVAAYGAYEAALEAGEPTAAVPHAERVLELGRAEYGESDARTAVLLVRLGVLYRDARRLDDAVRAFTGAIRIREKREEVPVDDLVAALSWRAEARSGLGLDFDARKDYRRALHLLEKSNGSDHPAVADALVLFGQFEEGSLEYRRARKLYRRAIEIREAALSPNDPKIGIAHFHLAKLYLGSRKYRQAERHYKRSLGVFERSLSPDHQLVVAVHEHLVSLYGRMGRKQDMEAHLMATSVVQEGDADIQPLYRVSPKYRATFGTEGSAVVGFTVTPMGQVDDAHILESDLPKRFEREILRAMAEWRYRPKVVDGQRVPRPDVKVRFEFVLKKRRWEDTGNHFSVYK